MSVSVGLAYTRKRVGASEPTRVKIDRIPRGPLDNCRLHAYTCNMKTERHQPIASPCLCNALRQASRAVSRLYDQELRGEGLRTTQFSLLRYLRNYPKTRKIITILVKLVLVLGFSDSFLAARVRSGSGTSAAGRRWTRPRRRVTSAP